MKRIVPFVLILLVFNASSQSLIFKNPTLKSGHDLKKNAVYTFKNVTDGVNAEVTITDLVNGATINKIDDNGGGVGYTDAFQPEIGSGDKGESYAVFTIRFIEKTSGSLYLLSKLQATALDIDGTSGLKEFDEIDMGGGTAAYMGGTLQIDMKGLPITGTSLFNYRADNITGIDKTGIDTLSKGNMFTVTNTDVNTITLKLGAITTTNSSISRQYSIYMMGFQYPNLIVVPLKLLSFTASPKNNGVALNWTTTEEKDLTSFIVERSDDGTHFSPRATVNPEGSFAATTDYAYLDIAGNSPVTYYRLRCLNNDGSFIYSTIQPVKRNQSTTHSATAYPNPFTASITVNYPVSFQGQPVRAELFNGNGQLLKTKSGVAGTVESFETSNLDHGMYVVRVTTAMEMAQFKMIKN